MLIYLCYYCVRRKSSYVSKIQFFKDFSHFFDTSCFVQKKREKHQKIRFSCPQPRNPEKENKQGGKRGRIFRGGFFKNKKWGF